MITRVCLTAEPYGSSPVTVASKGVSVALSRNIGHLVVLSPDVHCEWLRLVDL